MYVIIKYKKGGKVVHTVLDKNAEYIIKKLNAAGYEAYAVGGAVRDMVMGRASDDCDITTSARPEETKSVFSSFTVIETGIKHGTVAVIIDHTPYEITTYRTESKYADSRHPDTVTFVSDLKSDLSRRDFTMNAVAYSPDIGFVDPFLGIGDINSRVIRTVGDAYKRFSEDALRILRALRFASVIGFEIEETTSNAIIDLSHTVCKVSRERIFAELKKLILGGNAQTVINSYIDVIKAIIPINGNYKEIGKLPCNLPMRFTCLCGDRVNEALDFLRADNATKQACRVLLNSSPMPNDRTELKKYVSKLGRESAHLVVEYRRALYGEDQGYMFEELMHSNTALFISDLALNGNDLKQIGIEGRAIGKTLESLLFAVINGGTENDKESLLELAKNIDNIE